MPLSGQDFESKILLFEQSSLSFQKISFHQENGKEVLKRFVNSEAESEKSFEFLACLQVLNEPYLTVGND